MLFECRICKTKWHRLDVFLFHWRISHLPLVRELFEEDLPLEKKERGQVKKETLHVTQVA